MSEKKFRIFKMLFFDFVTLLVGAVTLTLGIAFFFLEPHLGATWRMIVYEWFRTKVAGGFYLVCGVGAVVFSLLSFVSTIKYAKE